MRELPETDLGFAHKSYSPELVLAIQEQAYEDGLRDAASLAKVISDKYAFGYYGQEVDTADEIEAEILALLAASQKEPQ